MPLVDVLVKAREVKTRKDVGDDVLVISKRDRTDRAFELKMRGVPTGAIAKTLRVDPSTINRDLRQYYDEYRRTLEQQPAANLIAEYLSFLDNIEMVCLFEANQIVGDGAEVDSTTGKIIRRSSNEKTDKLKYLQGAVKVRQMKMDILLTTGIIPKEPERLHHTLEQDLKAIDGTPTEETRTPEEVQANIEEMLKRSRALQ